MTKTYSGVGGLVKFAGWLFFSFDGRVGLKTYNIASAIACVPLACFSVALHLENTVLEYSAMRNIGLDSPKSVLVTISLILFFCIWWNWALSKKRCNDLDVSLWILYHPFSSMRLYFDEGDAGENSYGVRPKFTWMPGPWV